MRQAKPDDVFEFTTLTEIHDLWPEIERHLGNRREFWTWILGTGFSPATLAWVLKGMGIRELAGAVGLNDVAREELEGIRDDLVARLVRVSRPER